MLFRIRRASQRGYILNILEKISDTEEVTFLTKAISIRLYTNEWLATIKV